MFGRVVIDFYLMCSSVQLQTQKPKARPTWPVPHIKEREKVAGGGGHHCHQGLEQVILDPILNHSQRSPLSLDQM